MAYVNTLALGKRGGIWPNHFSRIYLPVFIVLGRLKMLSGYCVLLQGEGLGYTLFLSISV